MNERIKKLRKALSLTQQEFADKLGIKRGTVANYELERNEPSNSVISLICREFNVSEEWIRTGSGEMFIEMSDDELLFAEFGKFAEENNPIKNEILMVMMECLRTMSEKEFEPIKIRVKKLSALIDEKDM